MADSPFSGVPIIGGLLNAIFSSGIDQSILNLFGNVASWLNNMLHNLVGMLKAIGGFFSALWKFLKQAWEEYIKKALDWLIKHLRKWIDWLRQHVKSAIAFLKKIKKWYDQHILPFQLKQLAMIQHIRQILGILKAFHVKWATTLDNKLADIQNRIVETIGFIRGTFNGMINWLNAIYNPIWLAGRLHAGGQFIQELDATLRAAKMGGLSSLAPRDTTGLSGTTPHGGTTAMAASMQEDNLSGTGKFSEHSKAGAAAWSYQDRFGN